MFKASKNLLFNTILWIVVLMSGCLGDTTVEQSVSQGVLNAEFIHTEENEPIANTNIIISLEMNGEGEMGTIGMHPTDEDGRLSLVVSSPTEQTVTRIRFEDEVADSWIVESDIELELRFEEPYEEENLFYQIPDDDESENE